MSIIYRHFSMDFENEMSMWSVEIFIMSLDSSCDLLVYMGIVDFFVLWMDDFDALVMYLFRLTLKPSRRRKKTLFPLTKYSSHSKNPLKKCL